MARNPKYLRRWKKYSRRNAWALSRAPGITVTLSQMEYLINLPPMCRIKYLLDPQHTCELCKRNPNDTHQ